MSEAMNRFTADYGFPVQLAVLCNSFCCVGTSLQACKKVGHIHPTTDVYVEWGHVCVSVRVCVCEHRCILLREIYKEKPLLTQVTVLQVSFSTLLTLSSITISHYLLVVLQ